MSRVDELTLFSEVWDTETARWSSPPVRYGEGVQVFEIFRRETAGHVPVVKVVYEIDGHGVPREDFLAVIAALNTVRR